MSTLTSSQLHVKRSSTRLHAPPGGASSISFGPGGLGTVNAAVEDDGGGSEKAAALDPATVAPLPPQTGAYTSSNNNSSGYDYAPQKDGTSGGYGSGNAAVPSGYGSYGHNNNNSNWSDPYGQPPPTSSMGSGGMMMPPQQQQQQLYGAGPPRQLSSSGSMGSSRSWGSQPPLTSSKRDQNWERKRRQWLARKCGSSPMGSAGFSGGSRLQSAGPLGSSYAANMGGMNSWDDHGDANAPPSPLSKFVHQQSQKQQQQGGFGYVDYERIGTAQSQAPPPSALPQPPSTASYPRGDNYSSGGGGGYAPPSRSTGLYNQPPNSSGTIGGRVSHFNSPTQAASEYGYGYNATPASRDGTAVAGVATTGGGYGVPGSSGGNMGNRNVSSARQPPGGHSNWSPFS